MNVLMPMLILFFASTSYAGNPVLPKKHISMDKAIQLLSQSYPGTIKSKELEYEGGKWVYSFDLNRRGESNITEVQLDAVTGKIVSSKIESKKQEMDEAKEEAQEAKE